MTLAHTLCSHSTHGSVGGCSFGGHMEPADPSVPAAALREATEESGLSGFDWLAAPPTPRRRSPACTHPITCSLGVPTRHLDVQYCAVAQRDSTGALPTPIRSDKSTDLAWWPTDALPDNADAVTLTPLIAAGVRLIVGH